MKYIRTKDGIYEVKRETDITYELNTQNMVYRVYKSEVIKQADTIEELCDCFVIIIEGKPILCKYQKDKNGVYYLDEHGFNALYVPDLLKSKCLIYGAIWTDKGLIYVAKMNDKGELELL